MPTASQLEAKDGSQSSYIPFLPNCKIPEQETLCPISHFLAIQLTGDGPQKGTKVEKSFWDLHVVSCQ